jgi:hypothetical protein
MAVSREKAWKAPGRHHYYDDLAIVDTLRDVVVETCCSCRVYGKEREADRICRELDEHEVRNGRVPCHAVYAIRDPEKR